MACLVLLLFRCFFLFSSATLARSVSQIMFWVTGTVYLIPFIIYTLVSHPHRGREAWRDVRVHLAQVMTVKQKTRRHPQVREYQWYLIRRYVYGWIDIQIYICPHGQHGGGYLRIRSSSILPSFPCLLSEVLSLSRRRRCFYTQLHNSFFFFSSFRFFLFSFA